ncbi:MAG: hypothetical protein SH817_13320 [Leptospira sp.]|nr:hypothetical protein [Leptospira sp.]
MVQIRTSLFIFNFILFQNCLLPNYIDHTYKWTLIKNIPNECLLKSSIDRNNNLINSYLLDNQSTIDLIEHFGLYQNGKNRKNTFVIEIFSMENIEIKQFSPIESLLLPVEAFKVEIHSVKAYGYFWERWNEKPMRLKDSYIYEPNYINTNKLLPDPNVWYVYYLFYIGMNFENLIKNEIHITQVIHNSNSFQNRECFNF